MHPLFPTTSPVALATRRILAAYLSNHRLSPAEAASLSGTIADTLARFGAGASVARNAALVPTEEPPPPRTKPRRPRQAQVVTTEAEVPSRMELSSPMPESSVEPEPEEGPEPIQASAPQVAGTAGMSRKRKRPSRPRSKRGKASVPP